LRRLNMKKLKLKTVRAYHLRLVFQEFWGSSAGGSRGIPAAVVFVGGA